MEEPRSTSGCSFNAVLGALLILEIMFDDKIVEEIFNRTGANIIGMKLFEEGEANWSEDPPFHSPVFVLTHKPRSSWQYKGGTTFHFVNDGVESALQNVK